MIKLTNHWQSFIENEITQPYFKTLQEFIRHEYQTNVVYPPQKDIFKALELTDLPAVKVVILGQDPYHEPGQAHGLAFSVVSQRPLPPSLVNIYKEIQSDLGLKMPPHGNLTKWADQGVLLLNAILTVRHQQALSHQHYGWEIFTDHLIQLLAHDATPKVFLLWGNYAKRKHIFITHPHHLVLTAVHPSPLSAHQGFLGCRHFSKANQFLRDHGRTPINWALE